MELAREIAEILYPLVGVNVRTRERNVFYRKRAEKLISEQLVPVRDAIKGLGRGGCFCRCVLDDPMMGGESSEECVEARRILSLLE